jgi:hypothetical protein
MDRADSIGGLMAPDVLESVMKSGNVRQISPVASLAVFAALDGA